MRRFAFLLFVAGCSSQVTVPPIPVNPTVLDADCSEDSRACLADASCKTYVECSDACGTDADCKSTCENSASPTAKVQANAMMACLCCSSDGSKKTSGECASVEVSCGPVTTQPSCLELTDVCLQDTECKTYLACVNECAQCVGGCEPDPTCKASCQGSDEAKAKAEAVFDCFK